MSDSNGAEFGGIDKDVDGDVQSRTVQTEGRLNIPGEYLSHIDVEIGDDVFVGVDGDKIVIQEATIDSLGVLFMMNTVYSAVVDDDGLKLTGKGDDSGE